MLHVLALDLKDDPALIAEYEYYHATMRPAIESTIRAAGITGMTLYRAGNRLVMLMETDDTFSFERKAQMDADNPTVQEWEALMWTYQQALPFARSGEKWVLMKQIYDLP
ncbi:L-rhamnose mutarotase [Fibrella sp. HMF5335]|uniref:L-rhamnose mutarotase n=1 Tax=Fibrella rubiginis TaxID=2817060 RepID=A0A939JZD2_9BACT|nr:L-rhamnose mutarotase [Fibrella rubiginis]MBO0934942.1 L-rhamnose mutarotase [Fibrella rubiginis]